MKLKNNVKSFLISIIVGASISFSFYRIKFRKIQHLQCCVSSQSYFVYPNSSEEPLYSCWGAGSRGYKESYNGTDENKFKETVVEILENHVYLKKK